MTLKEALIKLKPKECHSCESLNVSKENECMDYWTGEKFYQCEECSEKAHEIYIEEFYG